MKAMFCDMYNFRITGGVSPNLNAASCDSPTHSGPSLLILNDQGGAVLDVGHDITNCLRAQDHGHPPVICFEPGIAKREGNGSRFIIGRSGTLRAEMGDNQPAVCYAIDQQGGKSNCGYAENVMPTLCSDSHGTPHALCYEVNDGQE